MPKSAPRSHLGRPLTQAAEETWATGGDGGIFSMARPSLNKNYAPMSDAVYSPMRDLSILGGVAEHWDANKARRIIARFQDNGRVLGKLA